MRDLETFTINIQTNKNYSHLDHLIDQLIKSKDEEIIYTPFSLLNYLSVINDTDEDYPSLKVRLESSTPLIKSKEISIGSISKRGERAKELIIKDKTLIEIDDNELKFIDKSINASLTFTIYDAETSKILTSVTRRINLIPYTSFKTEKDKDYNLLASYCLKNFKGLDKITEKAAGERSESEKVIALYNEIKSLSLSVQKEREDQIDHPITLPEVLLREKKGKTLDTAILFSSCLLKLGLRPLLILLADFALIGIINSDEIRFDEVEKKISKVFSLSSNGTITVFDPLCLDKNEPEAFTTACQFGLEKLRNYRGEFEAIDVKTAQENLYKPYDILLNENNLSVNGELLNKIKDEQFVKSEKEIVRDRFQTWEKKLLDLTLANKLINFKPKRENACLLSGYSGKSLYSFLRDDKDGIVKAVSQDKATQDELKSLSQEARQNDFLILNNSTTNINKLIKASNNSLEETGNPTLYLVIGLLSIEDNAKELKAPLLLLPVELKRENNSLNYLLKYDFDSLMVNQTFFEYLKLKKNLDYTHIYDFNSEEDYTAVIEAIKSSNQGEIKILEDSLYISNFTFAHYVMWKDIRERKDILRKNEVISSLLENKNCVSSISKESSLSADESDDMEEFCAPLAYDSTQLKAIKECANSNSFILDGPPGTGKSQTIVNMIVNAIYHGKKVLFVAEKVAALEVVRERLASLGLDKFALQLYSDNANKKAVLAQLKELMDNGKLKSSERVESSKTYEELKERKEELKKELALLHSHTFGSERRFLSLFEAINLRESTKSFSNILILTDQFAKTYTAEKDEEIKRAISNICAFSSDIDSVLNSSLSILKITSFTLEDQERIKPAFKALLKDSRALERAYNKVFEGILPTCDTMQAIKRNSELALAISKRRVPLNGLTSLRIFSHPEVNEEFFLALERYDLLKKKLADLDFDKALLIDSEKLLADLDSKGGIIAKHQAKKRAKEALTSILLDPKLNYDTREILKDLIEAKGLKGRILELYQNLKPYLGPDPTSLSSAGLKEKYLLDSAYVNSIAVDKKAESLLFYFQKDDETFSSLLSSLPSLEKNLNAFVQRVKKTNTNYPFSFFKGDCSFFKSAEKTCGKIIDNEDDSEFFYVSKINSEGEILKKHSLESLFTKMISGEVAFDEASEVYSNALANSYIKYYEKKSGGMISQFDALEYDKAIDRYKDLIEEYNKIAIIEVTEKITSEFENPNLIHSAKTPIGELRKIVSSQGKGITIRNMLLRYEDYFRSYFPCFLMSPLSAAQYLAADSKKFDIVIFDEASQIPTSEAVGPIARGNSLIVCGDPEQMPPSNYFKSQLDEDVDSLEYIANADSESLLDDCLSIDLPRIRLSFHYRSKHESLIEFSNQNFYGGDLYTFPSSDNLAKHIEFRELKRKNELANDIQPSDLQAIKDLLISVLDNPKNEKKSIGIIAFNIIQQEKIADYLNSFFESNSAYREKIEKADKNYFVKNLENVQGDERDIIIICIFFAKAKNGKAIINGPLTLNRGERRLNVAVTRSRERMIVLSSILYSDIDTKNDRNKGKQYLKDFLYYAQNASLSKLYKPSLETLNITNSLKRDIEKEIPDYQVDLNVGNSSFKVSLAVKRKGQEKYLLGVILDDQPPSKHISLRDRYYVQEQMLKFLDWKVLRIYTLEYLRFRRKVIKSIIQELNSAQNDENEVTNYLPTFKADTREVVTAHPYIPLQSLPSITESYEDLDQNYRYADIDDALKEIVRLETPISRERILDYFRSIFSIQKMTKKADAIIALHLNNCSEIVKTSDFEGSEFYWYNAITAITSFDKIGLPLEDVSKEELIYLAREILKNYHDPDRESLLEQMKDTLGIKSSSKRVLAKLNYALDCGQQDGLIPPLKELN